MILFLYYFELYLHNNLTFNKETMGKHKCSTCPMRAKYDSRPSSFAGRFWRWHINFCPGWKAYFKSLAPEEQEKIRNKYGFIKYR